MVAGHHEPRTIHSRFEECARRTPDSVALEYEGWSISYRELNRQANKLAHHLRETSGVRPDDRVAILVRHPPSFVTAAIAVLKAGGAYVPLNPDNPPGVIQQVLDNASPTAVLLESSTAASSAFFAGDMFVMDVMSAALDTPDTDPDPVALPGHLAYVIYTSGTTGTPKGVAVEHRAICNTVAWHNSYYRFGPEDVSLAIPPPSFDSSVEDIFCTLTAGARLLLPRCDRMTDRHYLYDLIRHRAVTRFIITPALYRRLLKDLDADVAPSLRTVTIAGEWFTSDLVEEHYRRLPQVRLHNEYGPSENAVCSTVHLLDAADSRVLIGKPISNTYAFVIREDGEPAGPEETGELYLAGAGLARCYLGDPELTDEMFSAQPSFAPGHERVYRTGDLVRVCQDGNLEFVGRRDRQVKIRGRRVELNHVAEVLAKNEAVDDVFVLHHAAPSAPPRLIAFVTGAGDADVERLGVLARDALPAYMAPSAVVPVAAIPITGNGKVDEAALLAMYREAADGRASASEPPSPVEFALLAIWQKLLASICISPDDDFFALGGDSLSVMDLVASVEEELGVRMESADAYTSRTIRSQAQLIEQQQSRSVWTS